MSNTIGLGDQDHTRTEVAGAAALSRPIGVFDSGVGGLSVLQNIRRLLPAEDLLYVADSRYCPYGGRSDREIQERAARITGFLIEQGAKAIVVACNTASIAALDLLRASFDVPIVGMEPAVKPAAAATRSGIVGVMATGVTLAGRRFASLAERFARDVELITQPCPGLVEQVEAGEIDGERTEMLLRRYLEPLLDQGVDTIVLGCTHYPFLRGTITRIVGPDVTLIDTGAAVARQTVRVLQERSLLASDFKPGAERFFTTGEINHVEPTVRKLWGASVCVEPLHV